MQIDVDKETCEYACHWDYPLECVDKSVLFNKTDMFLQMYKHFFELKMVIYEGKLAESELKLSSRISCIYDRYHKLYDTLRNHSLNEVKDVNGNSIFYVKFAEMIELIKILVDILDVYNDVFSADDVENLVQFSKLRNKMYYDFY